MLTLDLRCSTAPCDISRAISPARRSRGRIVLVSVKGMSDQREPDANTHGKTTAESASTQNTSLAVVFFCLGVVFVLTMDSPFIGLPFIALGIAFFSMGIAGRKKTPGSDEPGPGDPTAP